MSITVYVPESGYVKIGLAKVEVSEVIPGTPKSQ